MYLCTRAHLQWCPKSLHWVKGIHCILFWKESMCCLARVKRDKEKIFLLMWTLDRNRRWIPHPSTKCTLEYGNWCAEQRLSWALAAPPDLCVNARKHAGQVLSLSCFGATIPLSITVGWTSHPQACAMYCQCSTHPPRDLLPREAHRSAGLRWRSRQASLFQTFPLEKGHGTHRKGVQRCPTWPQSFCQGLCSA